jgi:hypothetical protein
MASEKRVSTGKEQKYFELLSFHHTTSGVAFPRLLNAALSASSEGLDFTATDRRPRFLFLDAQFPAMENGLHSMATLVAHTSAITGQKSGIGADPEPKVTLLPLGYVLKEGKEAKKCRHLG